MASKWNKPDSNAVIVDVDCTTDDAKDLCSKYGVQGYPTLKYFSPTTSAEGDTYEDGRDLKALNKFVKRASKLPCVPETKENCDKKDMAYIEEIKDMAAEKIKEEREKMQKECLFFKHFELSSTFEEHQSNLNYIVIIYESYIESMYGHQELEDLEAEHKASSDLFEKQKEEAMATMKRSEDLKQRDFIRSLHRYIYIPAEANPAGIMCKNEHRATARA